MSLTLFLTSFSTLAARAHDTLSIHRAGIHCYYDGVSDTISLPLHLSGDTSPLATFSRATFCSPVVCSAEGLPTRDAVEKPWV